MKKAVFLSQYIIGLLFIFSAFILPVKPSAANEPPVTAQKVDLSEQSLSVQEVGSEMIEVAIAEYNMALFDTAYKTLFKAKKYETSLSALDRDKLNKYLQASYDAMNMREEALQHIRAARQLILSNRLLEAKAHLKEIQSSPFLNSMEKNAVADSLKNMDILLISRQKQMRQLYEVSINHYKSGKLPEAREGFITVAQSGLLDLPDGKTAEDYIHQIDIVIGKNFDSHKHSQLLSNSAAVPANPVITVAKKEDVNNLKAPLPPVLVSNKNRIPATNPEIQNTVAAGYMKAVIKDTLIKVNNFLDNGDISNANICVDNAAKILNENRHHLDISTFDEYVNILTHLKNKAQKI